MWVDELWVDEEWADKHRQPKGFSEQRWVDEQASSEAHQALVQTGDGWRCGRQGGIARGEGRSRAPPAIRFPGPPSPPPLRMHALACARMRAAVTHPCQPGVPRIVPLVHRLHERLDRPPVCPVDLVVRPVAGCTAGANRQDAQQGVKPVDEGRRRQGVPLGSMGFRVWVS